MAAAAANDSSPHSRIGPADPLDDNTADLIKRHVDRVLELRSRIKSLQDQIQTEFSRARDEGLDRQALAEVVRRMLADPDELAEQRMVVALYETAYCNAKLHAEAEGDFCHAG